ncbi:MAG: hypothetical protein GX808_03290 [Syntrophomonadaceae bacterium]|nr:hypothetical protein [Syntrophomonadaceae bacterium]
MNNYWSALMTGALIGAAATYLYMHNDDKLTTATRRIKAKSKGALNRIMDMGQEAEELF